MKRTLASLVLAIVLVSPAYADSMSGHSQGIEKVRRVTASGAVTITRTDFYVVIAKTTPAATAVTLPISPVLGETVVIKDGLGDAYTNNITISPAVGTIDGAASAVINTDHSALSFFYDGVEWLIQ